MAKSASILLLPLVVAALAAMPAAAQNTAEVRGKIVDHEDNPVAGLTVIFSAESNPTLEYQGKTNKKGRYFVPGLFTGKQDDRWIVRLDTEDYVPVHLRVESRTANRILVGGEIRELDVKKGQSLPKLIIKPLGHAVVDFKVSPPELVQSKVAAAAPGSPGGGAPAPPKRDPWAVALTMAQDGDLEGSLEHFDEAIEDEPDESERHRAYAQVLYRLERFDQAEVEAKRAIELAPQDVSARMVLYSAYVGKGDMQQAQATLAEAKGMDPNNLDVLRQLAFLAGESGTTEDQVAAYEAIVAVGPDETDAWMALGDLYAQAGDNAKSEAAYQKVIEQDPQNADQIFFNLGALLINGADRSPATTRKAIGAFKKAVEINPKYAQAYRELAFALLNVGDRAGAREALENYVSVAPDAPDAAQMKQIIKTLPEA